MSARPVPCWTIVCDICGCDAGKDADYCGFGPEPGDARYHMIDSDFWLTVIAFRPNVWLDICPEHMAGEGPCQSCGDDDVTWAGNCEPCWEKAMVLPRGRCRVAYECYSGRCGVRGHLRHEHHCNRHFGHGGGHAQ